MYTWINFHITFTRATLYDVDPMNSLNLWNVLSVANSENHNESEKLSQTSVGFPKSQTKFLLTIWAIKSLIFYRPQKKLLAFVSGGVVICNPVYGGHKGP